MAYTRPHRVTERRRPRTEQEEQEVTDRWLNTVQAIVVGSVLGLLAWVGLIQLVRAVW